MDEKTFLSAARMGQFVAIGEYRHSKAEMLNWRDKQTGRAMSAPVLRHTVEFGDTSVAVSERLPESVTKIEDIKIEFKKGETVVLHIDELTRNLGLVSARGRLEKLNGSPGPGSPVGSEQTSQKIR